MTHDGSTQARPLDLLDGACSLLEATAICVLLRLGAVWEDHDLVFAAANGRPIYPDNLKRDLGRLVHLAGLPRIHFHDQRHTHVTLACAAGANIAAVSRRVGHARTSITMDVYAPVMPQQHLEVADRVGAVLFGRQAADGAADRA